MSSARSLSTTPHLSGQPVLDPAAHNPPTTTTATTTPLTVRTVEANNDLIYQQRLNLSDEDLIVLVERLRTPVTGPTGKLRAPVVVKDRLYHLRRYKECFVAREFVQAVMTLGYCDTRRDAVVIGQRLCRRGQMHHVADDHNFRDGYYFFRWYADDLKVARSLSVRRGSSRVNLNANVTEGNGSRRGGPPRVLTSGSSRGKGSTDKRSKATKQNAAAAAAAAAASQNLNPLSTATLTIQGYKSDFDGGDFDFDGAGSAAPPLTEDKAP